ncbi:MAG: protein trl [Deltaproteobacteria bacterium]|nr:protein trl [Deltaproteobacteria bacterium]
MHNRTTFFALVFTFAFIVATGLGCAMANSPATGLVTVTKGPVSAGDTNIQPAKEGRATCQSLLGIAAWGDCTVKAAAENGKITRIHSVDQDSVIVLYIYAKYETVVRGE